MDAQHRSQMPNWAKVVIILLSVNVLAIVALLLAQVFSTISDAVPQPESPRRTLFDRAINDAASVSPAVVSHRLFALSEANPQLVWQDDPSGTRIKVVAWMNEASFKRFYEDKLGDSAGARTPEDAPRVWVTLAPQVQNFCRQLPVNEQFSAEFRLKQYLGLDPNRRYERFVELWVSAEDLFRPCPDPQPDDTACNLAIDPNNPPQVKGVGDYASFFNGLKVQSYNPNGAPWTRLGYTYDWAFGERGVGASEYMLVPGAQYWVDSAYTTDQYCDSTE